jgi:hypothetical protein
MKLKWTDVLEAAGGERAVRELGESIDNRYLQGKLDKWINEKLATAHYLKLHETKNKRLMDIGTGAGWFPFVCKLYGHDCLGTDEGGRPHYDPVYEFLDIKFEHMLVYPHEPMQLEGKYDYITTHRAFFPQRPRAWDKDEWQFFFKDARSHLNKDGGLFLGCNSGSKLDPRFKRLPLEQRSHWGDIELGDGYLNPYCIPTNGKDIKACTLYIPYASIENLI